ncbi:hypothetical protein BLNAU_17083 [Blattamonas nauphoetae]|uniref:Uncharacterized protein n=1 Tax=Blattamonas nauphoetae TaxID=2049346 RepID=A0ABQ9X7S2_9EUKA|nr:hypothetical protein BLNAU_17083 [Blattamonas nauphoetae]
MGKRHNTHLSYLQKKEFMFDTEGYNTRTDIENVATALTEKNPQNLHELLVTLRHYSSSEATLPLLIQYNLIPMLTFHLTHSQDESVLDEVLWILTNLASLPSYRLVSFFDDTLLQSILHFTQSDSPQLLKGVWWLLKNLVIMSGKQSQFAHTLDNLGLFQTFVPSASKIFHHAVALSAPFLSPSPPTNTHIISFPSMILSLPDTDTAFDHLLCTLKHLIAATPQQIPEQLFTLIFAAFVTGMHSHTRSASLLLKTQKKHLKDLSSVFYNSPMPSFFPPNISAFPHLVVSVLKYAAEGLSVGYTVWTLIRLLSRHRRICTRHNSSEGDPEPKILTSDEFKALKQVTIEMRGFAQMIQDIGSLVGQIMTGADDVVDFYVNSGLLPALGQCILSLDQAINDPKSGDYSVATSALLAMKADSLGAMWGPAVALLKSMDLSIRPTMKEVDNDFDAIDDSNEFKHISMDSVLRENLLDATRLVSYCLSNIVAGSTLHAHRTVSEVFPGAEPEQQFVSYFADRLLDRESIVLTDDLYVIHGLIVTPDPEIFTLIENSEIIPNLLLFHWHRPFNYTADPNIGVFFEILFSVLQKSQRPNILLGYLKNEEVEHTMEVIVRGSTEETAKKASKFFRKAERVERAYIDEHGEPPPLSIIDVALMEDYESLDGEYSEFDEIVAKDHADLVE